MSSSDEEGFNVLLGGEGRVGHIRDATVFSYSQNLLDSANVLPRKQVKWMTNKNKNSSDIKFFKHRKTLKRYGQEVLTKLQRWFVSHCMNNQYRKDPGKRSHMRKLLMLDPTGTADPPTTDDLCWTRSSDVVTNTAATPAAGTGPATRSTTTATAAAATAPVPAMITQYNYTPTHFLTNLRSIQKEIYLHLRSTVAKRYAGDDAKTLIQGFIDDTEKERLDSNDMNEDNRFDLHVRVKWEKIKEFILEKICVIRMGSHHFLSMFTTLRKDNQTVIDWVKDIEKLHTLVAKQSAHWKAIVDEEVVPALAIWITEAEEKVIMDHVFKQSMHTTYENFEKLTRTMKLEDFRSLVHSVETKQWPSKFTQKRHKKALEKTLVTYNTMQTAIKFAEASKQVEELKRKLREANDKINHLEKKVKIFKRKLQDKGHQTIDNPIMPVTIPGAHGKAPKKGCQLCWDAGLGLRVHKVCDDTLREKAVKNKQEREQKRKDKARDRANERPAASKANAKAIPGHPIPDGLNTAYMVTENRKNPLKNYENKGDLCAICKFEDVKPSGCRHVQQTCFRRKGGPLKDFKTPEVRTTKSMQLANAKTAEWKKQKAATKSSKAKKAAKKAKKVGKTTVSKAAPAATAEKSERQRRNDAIPSGRFTAEEIAAFPDNHWSYPCNTFSTRYLLNDIAIEAPLDDDELDMLMPGPLRHDSRAVDIMVKQFHSLKGRHKFRAFRKNPPLYLRQTGAYYNHGYTDNSANATSSTSKRTRHGRTTGPTKRNRGNDRAPYQTGYVASSPAYAPPTKTARIDVTPAASTSTNKKGEGKGGRARTVKYAKGNGSVPAVRVEYNNKPKPSIEFEIVGNESPKYQSEASEALLDDTDNPTEPTSSPAYQPTSPIKDDGVRDYTDASADANTDAQSSTDSDSDSGEDGSVSRGTCCNVHIHSNTRTNTNITPEQVAEKVAPIRIERPVRRGTILDMLSSIMEIPDGLWCPATAVNRPVGVSYPIKHNQASAISTPLESETKNSRLLQAYMEYRAPDGTVQKGRVQIDTQSNINYVLSKYALPRSRRVWEATHAIGVSNNLFKLGRPNSFTIMKNGRPVTIDTVKANPAMFKDGCIALLGVDAIATLGIDLNYHLDALRHVNVKFRGNTTKVKSTSAKTKKKVTFAPEPYLTQVIPNNDANTQVDPKRTTRKRERSGNIKIERPKNTAKERICKHLKYREDSIDNAVCERAKEQALKKYPMYKQLERAVHKKTYLSERVCTDYLNANPDEYDSEDISLEAIGIGPDVPAEIRAMLITLLHKYDRVFSSKTNELPKPMKGVLPHKFKLKPDATPSRVGRPHFGKSQAKIINDWLDWALDQKLVEPAPKASWSSRLVLAPKYKNTTAKGKVPDGIRITWAGTGANEQIQKTVPTYPDAWQQIYKVANYKYKFSADGLKQYWSIPLDEASREVTAFWTPKGLFKFTRLVMGTKNAANTTPCLS